MLNVRVKNKKVFTEISCPCKTYLGHWENFSLKKASVCSRLGCSEKNSLVGGHIIKCHGNSTSVQYIVPLCRSCNSHNNTDCFDLKLNTILAPVADRSRCTA